AGDGFAIAAGKDHLAVLDHAQGEAGELVAGDGGAGDLVDLRGVDPFRRCRGLRRSHKWGWQQGGRQQQCGQQPALHCRGSAASMAACQARSRLPLHSLAMSASLKPRRRSSAVTFGVSVASIQPVSPPPPSKSEAMPTWSMPATSTMCTMWSTYWATVASGCSRSI